jgi:hypothetical protein
MSGSYLWYLPPAFFSAGGPWVRSAPGLPCALSSERAERLQSSDAKRAARQPDRVPNAVLKGTPSMPLPFPLLYPPL